MKRKSMMLVCIVFHICSYGMEQSLVCTKVCVIKGLIYDTDEKVDIIVVGGREQKRLNRTFNMVDSKGHEMDKVGDTKFMRSNLSYINIIKKEDDSDSVTETDHHPCDIIKHRDYNFYDKKMNSRVLVIVEPRMWNKWYGNERKNYRYETKHYGYVYGEKAIEGAKQDLFMCYQKILQKGLQKLGDKKDKSIAIPTLCTTLHFPRKDAADTAIAAITYFIKNNPTAYSRIELFVKKRCEYEWYCQGFSINPNPTFF